MLENGMRVIAKTLDSGEMRKVRYSVVIPAIVIILISGWILLGYIHKSGSANDHRKVAVVAGKSSLLDERSAKTRRSIDALAKQENISPEEAERRFATLIAQAREETRLRAGGHPPGVHIVPGEAQDPIDPAKVKTVPVGGVIDFDLIHNGKFPAATVDTSGLDSIYIDPLDISGSSLGQARLVKSEPGGAYLNGDSYARTRELRNAERTPNGKSGWTGLTRVFSGHGQLGDVMLDESDNLAAGITVLVPQSSINSTVSTFPAILTRLQDASGKTMSDLTWIGKNDRTYSLKIKAIDEKSVENLKRLAREIMESRR